MASAAESQANVVKVSSAKKPSFDPAVDPAQRMWDFFRKADNTDVMANVTPASVKAPLSCDGAADEAQAEVNAEGMTCSTAKPVETRRSALGAKGAL
jgi:polyhydroxybutyrate depolymerase